MFKLLSLVSLVREESSGDRSDIENASDWYMVSDHPTFN